jgi:hypothetical protein
MDVNAKYQIPGSLSLALFSYTVVAWGNRMVEVIIDKFRACEESGRWKK